MGAFRITKVKVMDGAINAEMFNHVDLQKERPARPVVPSGADGDELLAAVVDYPFMLDFNKAGGEASEARTVCVIGDSTFMHSGMTGLANVAYNQSNSTIIVLDNSITGMTGHQQNPLTGKNIHGDPAGQIDLEALVRSMGIRRVRVVDPYDLAQCDAAVKEELAAAEPSVIISRRPCVLLKYVKHEAPLTVNKDKCVGCKSCMQIGCPSLSIKGGKCTVDQTLCVGCKVCTQMCRFDAFEGYEKEGKEA